jgi:hypothetical protein
MERTIVLVAYWDGTKVCGGSSGLALDDEHLTEIMNRTNAFMQEHWKFWEMKCVTYEEILADNNCSLINELKRQVYAQAGIQDYDENNPPLPESEEQ